MEGETSRLLGIIGSLLVILGVVPTVGGLFMLVGIIFVLIALKGYADFYKDGSIFSNTLYTILLSIVGLVVFTGIFFYGAMEFLSSLGITNIMELNSWQAIDWQNAITMSNILPFVGAIVVGLVILFAFLVIASLFFKKSMNALSKKSGVNLFHTTGTVFLVGAILTIIIIGFIIIWVSFILLMIAFYQSKPIKKMQEPQKQVPPS